MNNKTSKGIFYNKNVNNFPLKNQTYITYWDKKIY